MTQIHTRAEFSAHHDHDPLDPRQLATLREQLEEQRRFRLEQLEQLEQLGQLEQLDRPRAGAGPSGSEVDAALAAGARVALHDVLAALRRMELGSYGRCTDCGTRLALSRLEVIPAVAQCLPCRSRAAQGV